MQKPKLFVYGKRDLLLRTFLPFKRKRLEDFYESCGNAEIHYGSYVHTILEDPKMWISVSFAVTNAIVNKLIIRFLDKNM